MITMTYSDLDSFNRIYEKSRLRHPERKEGSPNQAQCRRQEIPR